MRDNPDWPNQALLERRRQEAIAADPDDADVLAQCCGSPAPDRGRRPAALRRRPSPMPAARRRGRRRARQAWITGLADPAQEAAFPAPLGQRDHAGRPVGALPASGLARHAGGGAAGRCGSIRTARSRRGAPRADPQRRRTPTALVAALAGSCADRPGPGAGPRALAAPQRPRQRCAGAVEARRRAGAGRGARRRPGAASARSGPSATSWRASCCSDGDAAGAYALVGDHGDIAPRAGAGRGFPRRLHRAAQAARSGRRRCGISRTWPTRRRRRSPRAAPSTGWAAPRPRPDTDPKPDYEKAAAWPDHFLRPARRPRAGRERGGLARRIDALRDPAWNRAAVLAFTSHEVVRAAAWLVAWGDPPRARAFLLRMDELAPDPGRPRADRRLRPARRAAGHRGVRRPPHGPRRHDAAAGRLADAVRCRRRDARPGGGARASCGRRAASMSARSVRRARGD